MGSKVAIGLYFTHCIFRLLQLFAILCPRCGHFASEHKKKCNISTTTLTIVPLPSRLLASEKQLKRLFRKLRSPATSSTRRHRQTGGTCDLLIPATANPTPAASFSRSSPSPSPTLPLRPSSRRPAPRRRLAATAVTAAATHYSAQSRFTAAAAGGSVEGIQILTRTAIACRPRGIQGRGCRAEVNLDSAFGAWAEGKFLYVVVRLLLARRSSRSSRLYVAV